MTSVDTKWMSIEVPEGFRGSVERAEIVLEVTASGGRIRVMALRKNAPYSITMEDAKEFADGGDKENPQPCEELSLSNRSGYFSSRSNVRHFFSTVIGDTLMLLSLDGFSRINAEAAIDSVLAGLTLNTEDG